MRTTSLPEGRIYRDSQGNMLLHVTQGSLQGQWMDLEEALLQYGGRRALICIKFDETETVLPPAAAEAGAPIIIYH